MEIINRKVNDLIPYDKNPRKNDEAVKYVKASIEQFGFKVPIVIDADGVIVAGHTRVKAAKELGMEEVPCIVADDLTPEQIKAYRLADNMTASKSEWDVELLNTELLDLEANFDMADFGFEIYPPTGEVTDDDFDADAVADAIVEPVTKLGDIWTLGRHRLMCGDSTDRATVDRLMDGAKADISFTSPPYGLDKSSKLRAHYEPNAEQIKSLYLEHDDNANDWEDLIDGALTNMTEHSLSQFVNIQMLANNKTSIIRLINKWVDRFVDVIVWDKGKAPPQMQECVLNNRFEFIFIFDSESNTRRLRYGDFHGNEQNIIQISVGSNEYSDIHKAVFPVELPTAIIKMNGKCKSVLDLFGGTGTTLIACEQMNRDCYTMELSPTYCDVIIKRWESLTGQKAVLLNG